MYWYKVLQEVQRWKKMFLIELAKLKNKEQILKANRSNETHLWMAMDGKAD